ncbi:MAG TPA: phage tail assembly protein [Beijerinckiaceae bacterium]
MSEETQPATPAAPAPPRFVGGPPRSTAVPLRWPVEYDGKVYDSIAVHRMSVADVDAYSRDGFPRMFGDTPRAVIDALDADDAAAVNKAVLDFFPEALLTAEERSQLREQQSP